MNVIAYYWRISQRFWTMKQKLWTTLAACPAYCIDKELYVFVKDQWDHVG